MAQDKDMICKDCGQTFTFTAGEQEFFQTRGFTEPIRCKSCRDIRKSQKSDRGFSGGGGGFSGGGGGGGFGGGGSSSGGSGGGGGRSRSW